MDESDAEAWVGAYELEDDDEAVEAVLKDRQPGDLLWERDRLRQMLENLKDSEFEVPSKMRELLRILQARKVGNEGRLQQTVIFTRFYDTLTDIVDGIRARHVDIRIATYSGQGAEYYDPDLRKMSSVDRERVKEMFLREDVDVLVCTDAAAEGLNLQTANMLINFDLGWNPMKIEQRIGRIDRIGQRHKEIFVLNLCYADSAEARVYGRLWQRLQQIQTVVGTQQASILPIGAEDFRLLAEGHISAEDLMERAEKEFEQQRRWAQSMEIPPQDLYEMYTRQQSSAAWANAPVDREAIRELLVESAYLKRVGWKQQSIDGFDVFEISGIAGVADGVKLTVSRELYDRGLPGGGGSPQFASYGDPIFDLVLSHTATFDLPPCIRRVSVGLERLPGVEMVAYAALCRTPEGAREVRMIRSWSDVKSLELDGRVLATDESLSDEDVEPLKRELSLTMRREFAVHVVADTIERQNVLAAMGQQLLNAYVISELLEHRGRALGKGTRFLSVMRDIEQLFKDAESVMVNSLPADLFRPVARTLLFDVTVPKVGQHAWLRAPVILRESAMDLARIVEDRSKRGRGALPYETVLRGLHQRAAELSKEIQRLL